MKCNYQDIRTRIGRRPRWWDEEGVPRYVVFSPEEVANQPGSYTGEILKDILGAKNGRAKKSTTKKSINGAARKSMAKTATS